MYFTSYVCQFCSKAILYCVTLVRCGISLAHRFECIQNTGLWCYRPIFPGFVSLMLVRYGLVSGFVVLVIVSIENTVF